jgi:hypothetical protein
MRIILLLGALFVLAMITVVCLAVLTRIFIWISCKLGANYDDFR